MRELCDKVLAITGYKKPRSVQDIDENHQVKEEGFNVASKVHL